MDWRVELNGLLGTRTRATRAEQEEALFQAFLARVVLPAFTQVGEELAKYGRESIVRETSAAAIITVKNGDEEEISFRILRRSLPTAIVPYAEIRTRERKGLRIMKSETLFRDGTSPYGLDDVTTEDVIRVFLKCYRNAMDS